MSFVWPRLSDAAPRQAAYRGPRDAGRHEKADGCGEGGSGAQGRRRSAAAAGR
jgi:hypothetical protein